jgi:phosphotransferase system enzyme I (PtsP)
MLTRLREIVEKVASAPRLNEALNILVTDICLAMETGLFGLSGRP